MLLFMRGMRLKVLRLELRGQAFMHTRFHLDATVCPSKVVAQGLMHTRQVTAGCNCLQHMCTQHPIGHKPPYDKGVGV